MKLLERIKTAIQKIFGKSSSSVSYKDAAATSEAITASSDEPAKYSAVSGSGEAAPANAETPLYSAPSVPTTTEPAAAEPTAATPMTYEDYIKQSRQFYEEQKQTAYADAEANREGAIADAQASYAQNKATYGNNAEQLSQMGLSGGGYGDYLNSQAYAQKRADVNIANQNEIVEKKTADATYGQYISSLNQQLAEKALYEERLADERKYSEDKLAEERKYQEEQTAAAEQKAAEEKKDQLYASLWEGAQKGEYSAEAINEIAKEYELSDDQISSLQKIVTAASGKTAEETSKNLLSQALSDIEKYGDQLSAGYLDGLKELGLSDADYAKAQKAYKDKVGADATSTIKSTLSGSTDAAQIEATISNADEYYRNGKITQAQYQSVYNDYAKQALNGIAVAEDYQSAKSTLDSYKSAGKLSDGDYNALVAQLNKNNKKRDDISVQGLSKTLVDTDDINVKIGGKKFDLVSGDRTEGLDWTLNTVATGNKDSYPSVGTVIVCGNSMYIYKKSRKGENWHKVKDDKAKVSDAVAEYLR